METAKPIAASQAASVGIEPRSGPRRNLRAEVLIPLLPLAIAAGGIASGLAGHRSWFAEEDGPAENLQFVFLALSTAVAGMVARMRARRGERLLSLAYAVLAAGCFFVAGEEVSWGQRVFGIATPPEIALHNIQHEITLHNTYLLTPLFSMGQIVLGLAFTIVPFLPWERIVPARWDAIREALVPPRLLAPYFAAIGLWRLYKVGLMSASTPAWVGEVSEIFELILYLGVLLFMLRQLGLVRRLSSVS